ncbi:MAG: UDP-galactopyranose mutase, partial [Bacteroidales bacterium]|nr:UDP-galactopyranose mutase [Bacteroidales bacterium]
RQYNLPFNMNTFYQMWGVLTPEEARQKIDEQRQEALERMKADGVTEPRNLEEQALLLIGKDIYEILIKGYTEKQWGRKCTDLPAFIIKRLPVRFVHDNNYFSDRFQGIPIGGFNKLIDGLLDGVETRVNTNFFDDRQYWENIAEHILYTGKIDEYFDYQFGQLEWRSVRFEQETLDMPNYQGNAVMNFTDAETPYTRIIEHKHFEFGKQPDTVVSYEYPQDWTPGVEPYYPINNERNDALAEQYRKLAADEKNVSFGGRLGEYKYYDMDKIVAQVLQHPWLIK